MLSEGQVPFIDRSFRNQASGLPLAPKTYQAVPMPGELSQQDLLSSTSTIPRVECQYWQNISTIETDTLHSYSNTVHKILEKSSKNRLRGA